jgi:group I intron endonuclease
MIGIYKITNQVNNKCYIGQSTDIEKRFGEHKRREQNTHLKKAFEKYGIDNFSFEQIKIIPFIDSNILQIILDTYEKRFIKQYESTNPNKGYNKTHGGANGLMTEEAKRKLSESIKGHPYYGFIHMPQEIRDKLSKMTKGRKISQETRDKLREINTGKHHSEETKKRISEIMKGKNTWMLGKKASPEARANMSKFQKGRKHSPEHIEKIRLANIGQKRSPETCTAISLSKRGKPWSDERRKAYERSKLEVIA